MTHSLETNTWWEDEDGNETISFEEIFDISILVLFIITVIVLFAGLLING